MIETVDVVDCGAVTYLLVHSPEHKMYRKSPIPEVLGINAPLCQYSRPREIPIIPPFTPDPLLHLMRRIHSHSENLHARSRSPFRGIEQLSVQP